MQNFLYSLRTHLLQLFHVKAFHIGGGVDRIQDWLDSWSGVGRSRNVGNLRHAEGGCSRYIAGRGKGSHLLMHLERATERKKQTCLAGCALGWQRVAALQNMLNDEAATTKFCAAKKIRQSNPVVEVSGVEKLNRMSRKTLKIRCFFFVLEWKQRWIDPMNDGFD